MDSAYSAQLPTSTPMPGTSRIICTKDKASIWAEEDQRLLI